MEYKDYYKILGIKRDATAEEIKKRYRILARKYHPDVSKEKDAEEKFKEVKEAYDVLKNAEKRQAYDQLGSQYQSGQGFRPPPGWEFRSSGSAQDEQFQASGFSDFFENLFGQGAQQGRTHRAPPNQRGQDINSKITISLKEAFTGTERLLTLQEPERDPYTGQVTLKTRNLKVKIPAGVTNGQQIRLAQQGNKGIGKGQNGNLYLEIQITESPIFTLKERDIYLNLPVSPWEAALGAKVTVPTLAGSVGMTIPPDSQNGKQLRLKGRGLPGSPPGDQYITLAIHIPFPKNEAQRTLYQKMAEEMDYNPRSDLVH